jgi:hypothetical protein
MMSSRPFTTCRRVDGAHARVVVDRLRDRLRVHAFAPLDVDEHALDAVGLADLSPALAELAAADDDRLVAGAQEVAHRGVHPDRARAGQHERQLLGLQQPAQVVLHLAQAFGERRRAVIQHRPRHREEHPLRDRSGASGQQILFHGTRLSPGRRVVFYYNLASGTMMIPLLRCP